MSTFYQRSENSTTVWVAMDVPRVVRIHSSYFPSFDTCLRVILQSEVILQRNLLGIENNVGVYLTAGDESAALPFKMTLSFSGDIYESREPARIRKSFASPSQEYTGAGSVFGQLGVFCEDDIPSGIFVAHLKIFKQGK